MVLCGLKLSYISCKSRTQVVSLRRVQTLILGLCFDKELLKGIDRKGFLLSVVLVKRLKITKKDV